MLYEAPRDAVEVAHNLSQAISIHRYSSETIPPNMQAVPLARNRLAYVMTEEGDRPIHWTVVHFDGTLPARFGYDPAAPIIGDSFTDEHYRGRHIFPHILSRALTDLRKSGSASTVYALAAPGNRASIRGLERAGFGAISHLMGLMFAGFFLWKAQSRAK